MVNRLVNPEGVIYRKKIQKCNRTFASLYTCVENFMSVSSNEWVVNQVKSVDNKKISRLIKIYECFIWGIGWRSRAGNMRQLAHEERLSA